MLEFILVGRNPLGSAIRAAVLAVLVTIFWRIFLAQTWQLFVVSLISVLVVVVAAHWLSSRDNLWVTEEDRHGPPPDEGL